jgi:hypothetical protein
VNQVSQGFVEEGIEVLPGEVFLRGLEQFVVEFYFGFHWGSWSAIVSPLGR